MITTRSDRQTDRLLFKKRSRSRPDVAVLFGMAVSLVSTIIGLILSGPLALITIVASPLLVSYLVLEMKDTLKPMFVQKMCSLVVVDENGVDADPTETPAQ